MASINLNKRWVFYLLLLLFTIAKIPHLSYAFYWDESWVYAPAVFLMHAHGPSILPDAVPVLFSRGHPLFFHAACAEWMNIFGATNFSMHCFALFISLSLAAATFEIMRSLFNYRVALMSGVLLLLNQHFFIESAFVLTDIMLALFAFLTLYSYTKSWHFFTILFLTLVFYTKESGVVLFGVLVLDIFVNVIKGCYSRKETIAKFVSVILPIAFICIFFVIQKRTYGWYLYPSHTSLIHLDFKTTMEHLVSTFRYLFYSDQEYLYYLLFVIITIVAAYKQKSKTLLLFPLSAIFLVLSFFVFSSMNFLFHIFIVFLVVISIIFLSNRLASYDGLQRRFIRLSFLFCVMFVYFSGINFYEVRYLFPVLFLLSVILLAVLYDRYTSGYKPVFNYIFALMIVAGLSSYISPSEDFLAFDRMNIQQELVDYFEQNDFYDRRIYCRCFLELTHLKDKNTGFLRGKRVFSNVGGVYDNSTELAIFDNIDCSNENYTEIKNDPDFMLLEKFQKGKAWIEVYKKK